MTRSNQVARIVLRTGRKKLPDFEVDGRVYAHLEHRELTLPRSPGSIVNELASGECKLPVCLNRSLAEAAFRSEPDPGAEKRERFHGRLQGINSVSIDRKRIVMRRETE